MRDYEFSAPSCAAAKSTALVYPHIPARRRPGAWPFGRVAALLRARRETAALANTPTERLADMGVSLDRTPRAEFSIPADWR